MAAFCFLLPLFYIAAIWIDFKKAARAEKDFTWNFNVNVNVKVCSILIIDLLHNVNHEEPPVD